MLVPREEELKELIKIGYDNNAVVYDPEAPVGQLSARLISLMRVSSRYRSKYSGRLKRIYVLQNPVYEFACYRASLDYPSHVGIDWTRLVEEEGLPSEDDQIISLRIFGVDIIRFDRQMNNTLLGYYFNLVCASGGESSAFPTYTNSEGEEETKKYILIGEIEANLEKSNDNMRIIQDGAVIRAASITEILLGAY